LYSFIVVVQISDWTKYQRSSNVKEFTTDNVVKFVEYTTDSCQLL